jgi:hypothetical protein
MFTGDALRGFVNTLTVSTKGLTDAAAVQAIVAAATLARDEVIASQGARSGLKPSYRQVVDNVEGAPLESVTPDGYVMFAWGYLAEVVRDTYEALVMRSPKREGGYVAGIIMLVDGVEADLEAITADTQEVAIVASADYARKLEVGWKAYGPVLVQVGQHYVEETKTVSQRLYGDLANFKFNYVDLPNAWHIKNPMGHRRRGGFIEEYVRYPAIIITPRVA